MKKAIVNMILMIVTGLIGTVLCLNFFGWKLLLVLFLLTWSGNISNAVKFKGKNEY